MPLPIARFPGEVDMILGEKTSRRLRAPMTCRPASDTLQ
jgi:hypothetical protein